ncbi:MAG: lactate utilization protein [Clostridia bacterium]|nr:lactate utilization protein [Clostridia bacterium]
MKEKIIRALGERHFIPAWTETAVEAREKILAIIGNRSVGFGGSKTVNDLLIYDELQKRGNSLFWHWKEPKERKHEAQLLARDAEVYICSSNAILEDGRLINIDGTGNRVAALCFGPPCVIVVAGINKLCADYDSAIERIKRDACPPNARRLGVATPCAATNVCADCKGAGRMCNVTTILEYPTRIHKEFHVILVNEKLGL